MFLIPLNEVENVALFICRNFSFSHVLKHLAQHITHLIVVSEETQTLYVNFIEFIFIKEGKCLVTRPAILR